MPFKVLIVDDHALMRDGLRMNLEMHDEFAVVGEAADGRDALHKAVALDPDLIIMDIAMPGLNGLDATRLICERLPATKILVLSMYGSSEHSHLAVRSGARGFILKDSAGNEVITALKALMRGRYYFGAGVTNPLAEFFCGGQNAHKTPLESLSVREREVLQLVVEGKSTSQIAAALYLSPNSVNTYRSRIMSKLGVDNSLSLASFALQHGITPPKL